MSQCVRLGLPVRFVLSIVRFFLPRKWQEMPCFPRQQSHNADLWYNISIRNLTGGAFIMKLGLITNDLYCVANHAVPYRGVNIHGVSYNFAVCMYNLRGDVFVVNYAGSDTSYDNYSCYWLNGKGETFPAPTYMRELMTDSLHDIVQGKLDKDNGLCIKVDKEKMLTLAQQHHVASLTIQVTGAHLWQEVKTDDTVYDDKWGDELSVDEANEFVKAHFDEFNNDANVPIINAFDGWDVLPIETYRFVV